MAPDVIAEKPDGYDAISTSSSSNSTAKQYIHTALGMNGTTITTMNRYRLQLASNITY